MADSNNSDVFLTSSPEADKYLNEVTTDLDNRKHPIREQDEKDAYMNAYIQARCQGKSKAEANNEAKKAQMQRREDRKKEDQERKKQEEENKYIQENHAANEEALGMSFAPNDMASVSPISSEVGASDADISEQSESQMEQGEINIVLMFSILSSHDLKKTKNSIIEDGLTENLLMPSSLAWEHGSPVNYAEKKFITIDCSHLSFDSVMGKTITQCEMQDCLEEGISQVKTFLEEKTADYSGGTIHFSLAGFIPIDALPFAFAAVINQSLPNESCFDVFVKSAKDNFDFAEFEYNGWHFIVDYACLYEVQTLYFERKLYASEIKQMMRAIEYKLYNFAETGQLPEEDLENGVQPTEILYGNRTYSYEWLKEYYPIRKEEEQLWIEYQKAVTHAARVERKEVEPWFPITGLQAAHKFLGLTSIVCSPISLLDAGLHAIEWIAEGDEYNEHKAAIVIDLVCVIPFVRAGKIIANGGKMAAVGVGRGCKLLYYRGSRLIVRMEKGVSKTGRRRLAQKVVKAKRQAKAVENASETAYATAKETLDKSQKLNPLIQNAEKGITASETTVAEMQKNIFNSGKIFVDNFSQYMSTLKSAKEAFKRNSKELVELKKQQGKLDALYNKQAAASRTAADKSVKVNIETQSFTNKSLYTLREGQKKYTALIQEEKRIAGEIERLEKANRDMWKEAWKPWTEGGLLPGVKNAFKDWIKPLSPKSTFHQLRAGGLDRALATESSIQTVLGAVDVFTDVPSDFVKAYLDDGTEVWTSDTAIELGIEIEEIRAKYGYAKGENTYNPYADGSYRPKAITAYDLYE